jgi:hypothetical protein
MGWRNRCDLAGQHWVGPLVGDWGLEAGGACAVPDRLGPLAALLSEALRALICDC